MRGGVESEAEAVEIQLWGEVQRNRPVTQPSAEAQDCPIGKFPAIRAFGERMRFSGLSAQVLAVGEINGTENRSQDDQKQRGRFHAAPAANRIISFSSSTCSRIAPGCCGPAFPAPWHSPNV